MAIPIYTTYKLLRHLRVWTDIPPLCRIYCVFYPSHCPRHTICERVRLGYTHKGARCECQRYLRPAEPTRTYSAPRQHHQQLRLGDLGLCAKHTIDLDITIARLTSCVTCQKSRLAEVRK